MRLKQSILSGKRDGVYREYPLLDENGDCLWPGKYPNRKMIKRLENSLTEIDYAREYLLKAINSNDQIIKPEWIQYYDQLPDEKYLSYFIISVDPAFSTSKEADKSAIIFASLVKMGDKKQMFIHPDPFNGKWSSPNLIDLIESNYLALGREHTVKIIVEQAGQQVALIDQLKSHNLPVEGMPIKGQDKATRLWSASTQVKNGLVLFPKKGAEKLIQQLLFFGSERFDDLADSFTLACSEYRKFMGESEAIIDWI
jgi:predicted phage terminase large subunit-like protein